MQDWQAIASGLGVAIGAAVGAIIKARMEAKRAAERMAAVPPTPAPHATHVTPLPMTPIAGLLEELRTERDRRMLETFRADKAEAERREIEREQERTADALMRERRAHDGTREQLRHYRAYALELQERQRALDSGFTELGPAPIELPERVVEEDDRNTTRPPRKRR